MSAPRPITAVIVAAGKGTRMGGKAKQWRVLGGIRVIDRSIAAFTANTRVDRVVVVIPEDGDMTFAGCETVTGGATRQKSVQNALDYIARTGTGSVLIHDAARPLVSQAVINGVIDATAPGAGAAPGLPMSDTLWRGTDGMVDGSADRETLFRAQTPQGFCFDAILAAHRAADDGATDDVAIAGAAGMDVVITKGSNDNFKLTYESDFSRADRVLGADMDVRLGNGFDVHRFGDGDFVTLCGVKIPHDFGLSGHSDADVAMHALTDAIYGALARGDIGQHFPPSDQKWKGADSAIFLEHAVKLAGECGYKIGNLDVTIMCEHPKIGPHADTMRARLSEITATGVDRISVKATTTEKLGFTGRGEGIAASATALLVTK